MTLPNRSEIHDPLLSVLSEQPDGGARPKDIYEPLAQRFPQIVLDDLSLRLKSGANKWMNLVQFARWDLVEAGYIEPDPPGIWRLTNMGRRRVAGEADLRQVYVSAEPADERAITPFVASQPVVQTQAQDIELTLAATQRASTRPSEFEAAVAAAFAFMGYDVEHVGGAGDTDVVIDAPLGVERYTAIIDAKSTARGSVSDAQINWLALDDHRKKHRADYVLVIGPAFAGGAVTRRAEEHNVTLVTTEQLVTVVRLHDETPLTLVDFRTLFVRRGDERAFAELAAAGVKMRRHTLLLPKIVEQVRVWNEVQPNQVLAHSMTLFTALMREDNGLEGLTLDEVADAVAVLSSTTVGILQPVMNDGAIAGYVLTTTPVGASRRMAAFRSAQNALNMSPDGA